MIKKIRVDDLELGMFVSDFNVPWMDHPFLTSTRLLRKAKELDQIREHRITEVYIDTSRGKDSDKAVSAREAQTQVVREMGEQAAAAARAEEQDGTEDGDDGEFRDELRKAHRIYDDAKDVVADLMGDAQRGRELRPEQAIAVVDRMVEADLRNGSALSSLARLKNSGQYLLHHSVNVCVIALSLGRHLGLGKAELHLLGLGALLHDIGKLKLPQSTYDKPGGLSEKEFALVKTHPLHGAKMILDASDLPDACAKAALDHHERYDGGGYPRGHEGMGIGKFGLITAIADVFDAVTSDRVYRSGLAPHVAMQRMYEWAKSDFYPVYGQKFIQCMGIYPVGTVVCLETGEIGVVTRQNRSTLLRPHVRVVSAKDGSTIEPPLDLNLAHPRFADNPSVRPKIVKAVTAEEAGVDVAAVLARELRAQAA